MMVVTKRRSEGDRRAEWWWRERENCKDDGELEDVDGGSLSYIPADASVRPGVKPA